MLIGSFSPYAPTNSPKPDKFLYILSACTVNPRKTYPKKVRWLTLGYFESLEKAKQYLKDFCTTGKRDNDWDKELHHLKIEKVSLNTELETELGFWIYKKDGILFQEYNDTTPPFLGVGTNDLKFQQKEIVEVLIKRKLELAIVVTPPPSPYHVERLKEKSESFFKDGYEFSLDISDYIYNTIVYEKGITPKNTINKKGEHFYDHTSFLDIFPAPNSGHISIEQRIALEHLYKFYHQSVEE